MNTNKEIEEAELFTEIFFGEKDNTMTINCPDEDSEISIVIRDNGRKSIYSMNLWEAKEVVKFLSAHIKNEEECNQ